MSDAQPSGILEIEALERAARERTGLDDFGDSGWREPLARLLESAASEAKLSDIGRLLLASQLTDRLATRLEIEAWLRNHSEVLEQRLEPPIVLATLPRTGQTAAGWIFDRDPANQSLLTWFVRNPIPPPGPGANRDDPRIARERSIVASMPRELLEMHLYDAEEPDECHWLLSNGLRTPHEIYSMEVPTYYRWVRDDPGMRANYDYYRVQLQLLQSRRPAHRWVLKNSPHLLYLDALHAVMPDAIFVQFHRDPLKVLASNCRLSVLLRSMSSDRVDPHEVGRGMLELLRDYVERLLAFRASGVSRPWIDLRFRDFVSDPLSAIEQVYQQAGLSLDEDVRERMAEWVSAHPRGDLRRAKAADLAPYGIEEAHARAVFAEYCDAFDVPIDGI